MYCCWIAFEFVYLYFTVIETLGPNRRPLPLEEIAALFDGEEAREEIRAGTRALKEQEHEQIQMADSKFEAGQGATQTVELV